MDEGKAQSKNSLPQTTHSSRMCKNPEVIMIYRYMLMVQMLYIPVRVSFHPQLHACPLQAGHISIKISQNYPSDTELLSVKLI